MQCARTAKLPAILGTALVGATLAPALTPPRVPHSALVGRRFSSRSTGKDLAPLGCLSAWGKPLDRTPHECRATERPPPDTARTVPFHSHASPQPQLADRPSSHQVPVDLSKRLPVREYLAPPTRNLRATRASLGLGFDAPDRLYNHFYLANRRTPLQGLLPCPST